MRVLEIRDPSELNQWKSEWNDLLLRSASNTIFLTWEWITAWWSAYGQDGALRVLAAVDDDGKLCGIAPLRLEPATRYGQTVSTILFVGDGSNDSDYLDCIVPAVHEREVMHAFQSYWIEQLRAGALLMLNEVPETSQSLIYWRDMISSGGMVSAEADVPCGVITLPNSWEEYLGTLRPRFRTKVRSVLRNLENRSDVQFGFCETREEVQSLLPVLFDLHTRRWQKDGRPGVFGWRRKQDFYTAVSLPLLERGWLRFSWLKWKGRVIACQYGFTYSGVYSQLQEGYEPASEHWNVGIGLRAWSMRAFIRQGVAQYDFLGGVGRHKTDWGAAIKHSKRLLVTSGGWKNTLFARGPVWKQRGKEVFRRFVPEAILSRRRALAVPQAPLAGGDQADHRASLQQNWRREIAARLYYYSQLPRIVRPFRDRFQLMIQPTGNGRRIALERRHQSCARILIYHRVNDDQDPFFPAISTDAFERTMRYLSRNYRVLSLGEMLRHLESGSTEMVVAITFDDGYRDNHDNAFPILHRYGLPATIFLATSGMDSGEPLWFEKLALAVKTTSRESIDLEIDIPRRLWLRTEAERLQANGELFEVLRMLPDNARRQYLHEILRLLAAPDDSARRDKMLTWEQVRWLHARGIDFGGHTETHPFISRLTREHLLAEVCGCKRRIEEELQTPADFFAYPNGREEDFGACNKELIRAAGFRAALTTIWGMNYSSTDPMELKRGGPWETSSSLFAYKLDWYQLTNG